MKIIYIPPPIYTLIIDLLAAAVIISSLPNEVIASTGVVMPTLAVNFNQL